MSLKKYTHSLIDFIFPRYCAGCQQILLQNEQHLCLKCIYELPKTNYHTLKNNKTEEIFWGRIKIEKACSFLHFEKGNLTQKIIHEFKYKNHKELGITLGQLFGYQLNKTDFNSVDTLVPIPLHPDKLKKRGYNQSEYLALGMARTMHKNVETNILHRNTFTSTQTRKGRIDRWKNVEKIFGIRDTATLKNQHLLLIDDIVTTGATLEAAALQLNQIPNIKISIATLAITAVR